MKKATWCFKDEAPQAVVDSSRIKNFVRQATTARIGTRLVTCWTCSATIQGEATGQLPRSKALTPVSERGGLVPVRLAAMELLDHFEATIATVLAHRRTANRSEALIETLKVIFAQEDIVHIV